MKIYLAGAGNKIQHIRNFQELDGVERVVISDLYPWSYGNFVADASYLLPRFDAPDFFEKFDAMYRAERFDVCLPVHDSALLHFSRNRARLARYPFHLAMNPAETVAIVSDKIATAKFFDRLGLPAPRTYTVAQFLALERHDFPYFVKPRYIDLRGTEMQLYRKVEGAGDVESVLAAMRARQELYVVQEHVGGTEINVDFFCDARGTLKSSVAVKRLAMGAGRGIARGEIHLERDFSDVVARIVAGTRLVGANQLQLFIGAEGGMKLMEINGRFSGSSVLVKAAGVNYFDYFVRMLRGEEIDIREKPGYLYMTSWDCPHFFRDSPAIGMP